MIQNIKNLYHLLMAALAFLYYGKPAGKMTVIGITGTDGKTSTTHLVYHMLKTAGLPVSYISSVEANIMGKTLDTGFHVTTPSPWQIQNMIRQALDAGSRYLVLEVTSHALDQHRVLGTSIDIALVTNVSHEHLDYHKTLDNYLRTKAGILKGARYSVLNRDEANYKFLVKHASGKIISYSLDKKSAVPKYSNQGNPRLLGKFNRYNILAAASVARILKIKDESIIRAIRSFPGIPGRLEEVKSRRAFRIYIDFAHKINALENVLSTMKKNTKGRLIAVFGSAGLRDRTKRPLMGEVAARFADLTVLTAEDPRTEDVRMIIDAIGEGCLRRKAVLLDKSQLPSGRASGVRYFYKIPDRQEALNFAVRKLARKGDVVIACGKGHEKSMCYGNVEYPWDEKQAIIKALYGKSSHS